MLFPYGDDGVTRRRPYVTWTIIGLNVAVFAATALMMSADERLRRVFIPYGVVPSRFEWSGLLTATFLHADLFRLAANMLFLYVVGRSIEDALGHAAYLACYLAAGAGSMLWRIWLTSGTAAATAPCVGASGAVAGVLAMFIVLFPEARFRMALLVIAPGRPPLVLRPLLFTFRARSVWGVVYWLALQALAFALSVAAGSAGGVAGGAHMGGFVAGLALALALGAAGLADVRRWELSSWIFGELFAPAPGYAPSGWQPAEAAPAPGRLAAFRPTRPAPGGATRAECLRRILAALSAGKDDEAAELYREYAGRFPKEALDAASQIRVARRLAELGRAADALAAFEAFLKAYPTSSLAREAAARADELRRKLSEDRA